VGVVKRQVLRGLWRRLVGVGIIGPGYPSGSGLYNAPGRALWTPPCAAFTFPDCALRGTSGGATMTTPGGTRTPRKACQQSPRARLTGFSHRVGAPTPPRVRGSDSSLCPAPNT
jgi:hypothetical protein